MMFSVLLLLFVDQIFGATTTPKPHVTHPHVTQPHVTKPHVTHPTMESVVSDTLSFKYDPKTHIMAAWTHNKCYMYSMSATESTDVHTVHGLHTLENKLINMIDDTTQKYSVMSHQEVQMLSPLLAPTCNHAGFTTYKLN